MSNRRNNNNNKNGNFSIEDTGRLLTKKAGGSGSKAMVIAVAAIAVIAMIVAVITMVTLLGSDKNGGQAETETKTTATSPENDDKEDNSGNLAYNNDTGEMKEIYRAYAEVLRQNESDIRSYDWQNDSGRRCVALYDLNGDGTPELMFFSKGPNSMADLHVYTYVNDGVVECSYGSGEPVNNYDDTLEGSAMFTDTNVAAGTNYMIYSGREAGSVYVAFSMGDETMYYHNVRFAYGSGNSISISRDVENRYGPNDDYSGTEDVYYVDGSKVSNKEGVAEFKRATDAFSRLLMYSGSVSDMTVFDNVKTQTPVAVSYDEAIRICSN